LLLGYNTNGLAHHRLEDAIDLLADHDYQSIAITLDVGCLDPFDDPASCRLRTANVKKRLQRHGMRSVIETGARYLLNPRKKHDPTLMDPDPERRALRVEFLSRAIDLAAELDSDAVSLWSGRLEEPFSPSDAMDRLAGALQPVLDHAEALGVTVAFEPEPGMFIDTFERFHDLDARIGRDVFQLTVDIGHVHCVETGPIGDHLHHWGDRIRNIHIEDMNRGVHEHLNFGEGTIDFVPVLRALRDIGYSGGLHVELSRHSHMAIEMVENAARFLRDAWPRENT
jgi:sugar phosphate isomerase/epimerase